MKARNRHGYFLRVATLSVLAPLHTVGPTGAPQGQAHRDTLQALETTLIPSYPQSVLQRESMRITAPNSTVLFDKSYIIIQGVSIMAAKVAKTCQFSWCSCDVLKVNKCV